MSKSKKSKVNPFKVKKSGSKHIVAQSRTIIIGGLVERARHLQSEIARVKPMYEELDKIVEELLKVRNELPPGVAMVDTFADSNKRWKSVCMTRFELAFSEGDGDE